MNSVRAVSDPAADRLLDRADVAHIYSIHEKTVPRWVAKKLIPAPIDNPLWTGRRQRWSHQDIDAHIASLKSAQRRQEVA